MKFSIIIPVYNVEQYILKCLKSIEDQTYNNYEVIIVNDGSPDNSEKVIKEYIKGKNKYKYYKKVNGGLSDARNYGLKYVTGDYIIFIDSDDYINNELLENINKSVEKKSYDLVRFEAICVDDNGKEIHQPYFKLPEKNNLENTIDSILKSEYVEPAWLYAYNKKFWDRNHFLYIKNMIHEDYGLTPIVLAKSTSIKKLNYTGYCYVFRNNSIMNQIKYEKLKNRTNDFYKQYLNNVKQIKNTSKKNKMILNFCTLAMIYKLRELNKNDCEKLLKKLKRNQFLKNYYILDIKTLLIKIKYILFMKQIIAKLHKEYYKEIEV